MTTGPVQLPEFCQRALADIDTVPAAHKADLYDVAAYALQCAGFNEASKAAERAATDIRDAEASQRLFEGLLAQTLPRR